MKNYILLGIAMLYSMSPLNAQFEDDMESYTDGQPIYEGHWTDWGCGGGPGCAMMSSSAQAHGGQLSGLIPDDGTTDAVLDLGNKIFGSWCIEFYMFVPANKEAYWNLQGEVPIGNGEWIVGNIHFNQDLASPGIGLIDDAVGAPITFTFPHDEWFRIAMSWNIESGISLATWEMSVNNEIVIPIGTAFTSANGTTASSLGGINFFSINTNNYFYVDTITYNEGGFCGFIVNTEDFNQKEFKAYPNPIKNNVHLSANEAITSMRITNMLGQVVHSQPIQALETSIDLSKLSKGTYFIHAIIGDTSGVVKIIK